MVSFNVLLDFAIRVGTFTACVSANGLKELKTSQSRGLNL